MPQPDGREGRRPLNFVNAIAIGLVGFFVLLLGFWYTVEVRSDEEPALQDVALRWEGGAFEVTAVADNPRRTDLHIEAVSYELSMGGSRIAHGTAPVDQALPAGKQVPLRWRIEADGLAQDWWREQAQAGGDARLELEGHLVLVRDGERDPQPFRWSRILGDPTDSLEALRNCPQAHACLAGSDAGWREGEAVAVLQVRASEGSAIIVQQGTARWLWQGREVARADVPRVLVEAAATEEAGIKLEPDAAAMAAAVASGLAACGPMAATLVVTLQVEHATAGGRGGPYDTEVSEVRWEVGRPWTLLPC